MDTGACDHLDGDDTYFYWNDTVRPRTGMGLTPKNGAAVHGSEWIDVILFSHFVVAGSNQTEGKAGSISWENGVPEFARILK